MIAFNTTTLRGISTVKMVTGDLLRHRRRHTTEAPHFTFPAALRPHYAEPQHHFQTDPAALLSRLDQMFSQSQLAGVSQVNSRTIWPQWHLHMAPNPVSRLAQNPKNNPLLSDEGIGEVSTLNHGTVLLQVEDFYSLCSEPTTTLLRVCYCCLT